MGKAYEFLKECGTFYVLTVNGDKPAGRPFGAIMEYEGTLYFATSPGKDVYNQMTANPNVQLLALKPGTRDWLRVSGKAVECHDLETKRIMLEVCPNLKKHYDSPECAHFAMFALKDKEAYLNIDSVFTKVD